MEPDGSLLACSEEPDIGAYPETHKSIIPLHTVSLRFILIFSSRLRLCIHSNMPVSTSLPSSF
jgi:hypothetical protein